MATGFEIEELSCRAKDDSIYSEGLVNGQAQGSVAEFVTDFLSCSVIALDFQVSEGDLRITRVPQSVVVQRLNR